MPAQRRVADRRTALYRLFDAAGKLLYIGIAVNPPSRWAGHAADKLWWGEVARITIHWYDTWGAAEAAEATAIRQENPLHNVVGVASEERAERLARAALHRLRERPTGLRAVKAPADLWDRFDEACQRNASTRALTLRQFIRWYVGDEGATLPHRPEPVAVVTV